MMLKRTIMLAFLTLIFAGLLAACGGGSDEPQTGGTNNGTNEGATSSEESTQVEEENFDPVTIKFGIRESYFNAEEFERYIAEPTKEMYPHITVEPVWINQPDFSLDNLIVTNQLPDLVAGNTVSLAATKAYGFQMDITELIEKHNFDLDRMKPFVIDAMKKVNGTDYLVGFPYTMHFNALYYNKDIFDRFGVNYPVDGMTWDEVIEVAKQVTRLDEGVQYRGLEPDSVYRAGSQLSLPVIDNETDESLINTDEWAKVYSMVKSIYDIPGNETVEVYSAGARAFTGGTLAMLAQLNIFGFIEEVKDEFTNWDMVSYPVWPEKPTAGTQIDAHLAMITSTSEHKDDAFRVLEAVVSDEAQMRMAEYARLGVLKGEQFEENFGSAYDFLEGKNVAAVFKTEPSVPEEAPSIYFNLSEITNSMKTIMNENLDVNTALRQLEEQMNQRIAEAKKANE